MSIGFSVVFPILLFLVFALPVIIGIYVYRDASRRGMNAVLWTLLAIFVPGFVGLIIYLIVRSDYSDAHCQKCGGMIRESFAICPHCGTPIPEEQKEGISGKTDKKLGTLLFLLIVVPIVLCIILIVAASMYTVQKDRYSLSHKTKAAIAVAAEGYSNDRIASCDVR